LTSAKQAQSRVKALERMEKIAPVLADAEFTFEFKEPLNVPNPLLSMLDASFGYPAPTDAPPGTPPTVIVRGINRSVLAGQRIGIGHLGHPPGIDEAGHLDAARAGGDQPVDQRLLGAVVLLHDTDLIGRATHGRLLPINLDPPEHTKYRAPLQKAFSPKTMLALKDSIRALANELIDKVIGRGHCDFMVDIAEPLPVQVFLKLLGLPLERQAEYRAIVRAQLANTEHDAKKSMMNLIQVTAIMRDTILERRDHPRDDMLSMLWKSEIDGRPTLREGEVILLDGPRVLRAGERIIIGAGRRGGA